MYWLERIPVCGPPSTGRYQCFDLYRGVPTGITLDFDRYWSVHLDVVDGGIFKVFRYGCLQVPARIEKLIADKQLYAAVQLHVQSMLVLEREGLQVVGYKLHFFVGALQDVRSELAKLRGTLFYKVLEELHSHIYNKGEYM
ncbi:hypothetical protein B296_00014473 [Ensete ventricosum]|uniref:Exocyst complex component Sec8 n=1 Tax=Ensete ventricosum TaxID=4639 RepID=A0A427A7P3_ENSVE|nr:hypothetical protein B296_00014473 [Ensete ventricosum]